MVAPVQKTQAHIFNIASYRDRYLHYDTSEYVNNVKDFASAKKGRLLRPFFWSE